MVEIRDSLERSRQGLVRGGRAAAGSPADPAAARQVAPAPGPRRLADGRLGRRAAPDRGGRSRRSTVSRTAAWPAARTGGDRERGLQALVEYLEELTGWRPGRRVAAAGAAVPVLPRGAGIAGRRARAPGRHAGAGRPGGPVCRPGRAARRPMRGLAARASKTRCCRSCAAVTTPASGAGGRHARGAGADRGGPGRAARPRFLAGDAHLRRPGGAGQLASDIYVKQLFGQVNLQLRRMSQGHTSQPERCCAMPCSSSPRPRCRAKPARLLRAAWGIEGQVPRDYLVRRYGRIDGAALEGGEGRAARRQGGLGPRRRQRRRWRCPRRLRRGCGVAATSGDKLTRRPWAQLLRTLAQAAGIAAAGTGADGFQLEMAQALLFVEHGLDGIRHLPVILPARPRRSASACCALARGETVSAAPPWQGELARTLQQDHTVAALAARSAPACARWKTGRRILRRPGPPRRACRSRSAAASIARRPGHPRPGRRQPRGRARARDRARTGAGDERGRPRRPPRCAGPQHRRARLLHRRAGAQSGRGP